MCFQEVQHVYQEPLGHRVIFNGANLFDKVLGYFPIFNMCASYESTAE